MKPNQQKPDYIKTFAGIRIQIGLLMLSIVTSYGYWFLNETRIYDQFIVVMLRFFMVFADFGLFLAIGYLVQFKRGVMVCYIYKVLAFMSLNIAAIENEYDFVMQVVGISFGLVFYYKITLFLIVFTASYIVEIDYEEEMQKQKQQTDEEQVRIRQEQNESKRLLTNKQSKQSQQHKISQTQNKDQDQYEEGQAQQEEEMEQDDSQSSQQHQQQQPEARRNIRQALQSQLTKTIQRIRLSLRYHKELEFYKKLEIFYFIFYNSTVLLLLFPLQEWLVDFTKVISLLGDNMEVLAMVGYNSEGLNKEMVYIMNTLTIVNVVCFWAIIMIGEFRIKPKHPQLIKSYILSIPFKFIVLQIISLSVLILVLHAKPLSSTNQQLKQVSMLRIVNYEALLAGYLIHLLIPLLVCFLLLRLYLGLIFSLNKLVSRKYSFYKSDDNQYDNLDNLLYQGTTNQDIIKVRHFIISQQELIPRHKLKRYTQQQRLRQYINQESTTLQIQSLFQDFLVLDMYNKLSRYLMIWMYYVMLGVFLVQMNINDTYLVQEDKFFEHVPCMLLFLGIFFVNKYDSQVNVFYPRAMVWWVKKVSGFLVERKAFNFVRLLHFYAVIFAVWAYRMYSELMLPTHQSVQDKVRLTLFNFYQSPKHYKHSIMSSLLSGWSQYFTTHTSQCDYSLNSLIIDSMIILLFIVQLLCQKQFYTQKSDKKVYWDPILMLIKILVPIYALYVFVIRMECLDWPRTVFCCFVCFGVMFMHTNADQLERGIKRDEQGKFEEY